MPTTKTKTLTIGVSGFPNQIGPNLASAMCAQGWAKYLGIDEGNETLMTIAVIRALFVKYDYHWIKDCETFGDDTPRSLRHWIRAYRLRFENDLPLYQQLIMRAARKRV